MSIMNIENLTIECVAKYQYQGFYTNARGETDIIYGGYPDDIVYKWLCNLAGHDFELSDIIDLSKKNITKLFDLFSLIGYGYKAVHQKIQRKDYQFVWFGLGVSDRFEPVYVDEKNREEWKHHLAYNDWMPLPCSYGNRNGAWFFVQKHTINYPNEKYKVYDFSGKIVGEYDQEVIAKRNMVDGSFLIDPYERIIKAIGDFNTVALQLVATILNKTPEDVLDTLSLFYKMEFPIEFLQSGEIRKADVKKL